MSFVLGTSALGLSKILENMEIGHNVMHGQYDWTGDPALDSHRYEWDNVCTGDDWRHSHNFEHHTFTNIVGKEKIPLIGELNPEILAQAIEVTPVPQHGERHWIATFHDGTFDVVATGAPEVCGSRVEGCSPSEALNKLLGVGQTKVLDEVA